MKLNQINPSAIITGRCPSQRRGVVARAVLEFVLLVGFVLLGGMDAGAQKPDWLSLRPDNQLGGPAGGLPRPPSFHNPVRNRTWCEIQKESWGAVGTGILNGGHFLADVGWGVIQVAVANTTGHYLPNPNNPSGFFEMTQGDALRALVEGPLIAVDDIFTGDGLKACEFVGGACIGRGMSTVFKSAAGCARSIWRKPGVQRFVWGEEGSFDLGLFEGNPRLVVTEELIRESLENASLNSQQVAVSIPRIQTYVDWLLEGRTAPPINIDKGMIVNGNHRYIAHQICKMKCPTQDWLGGRPDRLVPWNQIRLEPIVWPD